MRQGGVWFSSRGGAFTREELSLGTVAVSFMGYNYEEQTIKTYLSNSCVVKCAVRMFNQC